MASSIEGFGEVKGKNDDINDDIRIGIKEMGDIVEEWMKAAVVVLLTKLENFVF